MLTLFTDVFSSLAWTVVLIIVVLNGEANVISFVGLYLCFLAEKGLRIDSERRRRKVENDE